MDDLKQKLQKIANLESDEIGKSEENVKQKIAVPFLDALGHHRNQLDFEYGVGAKRVDIFIKGLPIDCKVIIDTKNYNEDLDNHLEQIGLYAFKEGAILALIINGNEIRIYDPFFRGFSFRDSLLFSIKRNDLSNDLNVEILSGLLSRENLENKKVKEYIEKRELEIIDTHSKIEKIKEQYKTKKKELSNKKEGLIQEIDKIQENVSSITEEINQLDSKEQEDVNETLKSIRLPYIRLPYIRTTTQEITPSNMQQLRVRNVYSKSSNIIEIVICNDSPKKFNLIPCPKQFRHLFPGYKMPFILETDVGEISAKVTSAPKDTHIGDPNAGSYIKSVVRNDLTRWYKKHKDLKFDDKIIIEVLESKKRYRLNIP